VRRLGPESESESLSLKFACYGTENRKRRDFGQQFLGSEDEN
jgi:hypothetical protein